MDLIGDLRSIVELGLGGALAVYLVRTLVLAYLQGVRRSEERWDQLWKSQTQMQQATLEALMNSTRALDKTVDLQARYLARSGQSYASPDSDS